MNFPNRQENTGIALPGGQAPQGEQGKTPPAMGEGQQPPDWSADQQPPAGFGQGQQAAGATCSYTAEFTLSEFANSFSSVTDYCHTLQKQGSSYICTACGEAFADAAGKNPLSAKGSGWVSVLLYVLVYLAGAATATAVFAILLLLKKRKK